MHSVARLDFTQAPPGYGPHPFAAAGNRFEHAYIDNHSCTTLDTQGRTAADALKVAWGDYKARHSPPGMFVCSDASRPMGDHRSSAWCWGPRVTVQGAQRSFLFKVSDHASRPAEPEARAAAWRWYEARVELYGILRKLNPPREFWPLILTWSDQEWIEVHGFLVENADVIMFGAADTLTFPEVLR